MQHLLHYVTIPVPLKFMHINQPKLILGSILETFILS